MSAPQVTPSKEGPGEFWQRTVDRYTTDTLTAERGGIVFVGDSITMGFDLSSAFPGAPVINRGIGGERTDHVLQRIDTTIAPLEPRAIFLLIGINDLLFPQLTVDQVAGNHEALVLALRKAAPEANVYVQTVMPVGPRWEQGNPGVVALNEKIREAAARSQVELIDLHALFVDETGHLKPDFSTDDIHLSPAGYATWADAIREKVESASAK